MSLRDYYAGQALAGILANPEFFKLYQEGVVGEGRTSGLAEVMLNTAVHHARHAASSMLDQNKETTNDG